MAVAVAQVAVGETPIVQAFFHLGRVRETAIALTIPQQIIIDGDLVDAARTRQQIHRGQVGAEGLQQLLGHPGGAQQPVTL